MIPDLPPPIADAYDNAKALVLPDTSWASAIKHGTPPFSHTPPLTVCPGPFGATIQTSRSSHSFELT